MFERFTDRARRVVVLSQEEARLLNHNYIGTEHILLGLIHEGEGVAAQALATLDISLEETREHIYEMIGHSGSAPSGHIPFTPRAKKVLELSLREALQLGHNYIGTEHILLGLIREGEGVAAQVLAKLGGDLSRVRQQVIQLLSGEPGSVSTMRATRLAGAPHESGPAMYRSAAAGLSAPRCSFCGRDIWEVDHYVAGASAFVCDRCIAAAHVVLESSADDQQLLELPPRVFGTPPDDDPRAVDQIVEAFNAVFGSGLSDQVAAYLEDGEQLVGFLLDARERYPSVQVSDVVIERVRFSTPEAASVGFALVLDTGGRLSFVGTVARSGGRWLVTRTTIADVLRTGGISLPPPA